MPNSAIDPTSTFRSAAAIDQGCAGSSLFAASGDIAYSGVVSLGDERWVYVRDTKNCREEAVLGNRVFGVVSRQGGQLVGTEVALDLSHLSPGERPTDLESICLVSDPDGDEFELLAAESGGYDPRRGRRIFKFRFERLDGRYVASIAGGPVSYDQAVQNHAGAPHDFQAEGMLCSQVDDSTYKIVLGGRGRHLMRHPQGWETGAGSGRWVERKGGGLLPLVVRFAPEVSASVDSDYAEPYPEVVAPHCAVPDGWTVIEGEWRDIADLHRIDGAVWAASTFEGEIGRREPEIEVRNHYCSVIYRLCDTADCRDLWQAPPVQTVTSFEVRDTKVEGLATGSSADVIAIASDNESTGLIDTGFSLGCDDTSCDGDLMVFPRTRDLKHPVAMAQEFAEDRNVLVVFDVDDTLLAMQQDLGGNAWYTWQSQISSGLRPSAATDGTVVAVEGNLLDVQGILFSLFDMVPTQDDMANLVVTGLDRPSIATFALTARGPGFHDATHRELHASGVRFPNAPPCTGELCASRGVVGGDHVVAIAERQLGADVARLLRGRDIAVDNGVMMVSGQDKGVMLRLLLKNVENGREFDRIVFVDDDIKNVINVALQAEGLGEQATVHPFHYTHHASDAAEFLDMDEGAERRLETARRWAKIRAAICEDATMDWCR
ncbi:MAG: DUF2608 domain-containing protein [Pseudomonadota bacterium]